MKVFSIERFKELAQLENSPCISIYTPTSRQSTDAYGADKLYFKNMLTEARRQLTERYGMASAEVDTFLAEATALLDNQSFWMHASDMLACFITEGQTITEKLPLPVDEPLCMVGQRPYLLPLIPELNDDGHYYLMVLNLHGVSLFEATRSTIQQIDLPGDAPTSFTEEQEDADNQKQLQHQSGVGQAGAIFHGQGSGSDEERKEDILQHYHRLTNEIDPILHQNPLPLVLAGVEYLIPIFKQATKYPHVMEPYLTGSYTDNDMLTLSAEAWELVEDHFRQERLRRKEEYGLFASQAQASDEVDTTILTAISGGVDTLFVKDGRHRWGTYDEEKHQLRFDDGPTTENYCLLNEAATRTKLYGGKVYVVDDETMPAGETDLAGVFRYPIAETADAEAEA